ncbi:hypothetical protein NDU88_006780 [Pleurodeles waltl]|uniref:Uncharacterized protein n=1 Tax=Pleurodeles waltl TaxID=8319 RepID=A0AAV7N2C7_PLEWA|nr:hypothetical protein NDU88_006780 [Pleurodeles waltl]
MLVLGTRQEGMPGNPEGIPEGSGGSGGQRGTARGKAHTDCSTSRARSFGRHSSTGPTSSRTHATSRHHKRNLGNLGSFSGVSLVSLVAISRKNDPKAAYNWDPTGGWGCKAVAAEGGRGKGGSAGPKSQEFTAGGRSPPLAPCHSALPAALYRRLPCSFTHSLLPFCRHSAASSYRCCGRWRATGCWGLRVLPPACRVHRVSSRLSWLSGIAFSHSRCEPPGRDVWCVFV